MEQVITLPGPCNKCLATCTMPWDNPHKMVTELNYSTAYVPINLLAIFRVYLLSLSLLEHGSPSGRECTGLSSRSITSLQSRMC